MRRADTSVKCGSVGKFEVRKVDSTAVPCLVIEKHWFSINKVKVVLAHLDVCRIFLAEFDKKPVAVPVATAKAAAPEPDTFAAQRAILEAQLAEMRKQVAAQVAAMNQVPAPVGGRFNPEAAAK